MRDGYSITRHGPAIAFAGRFFLKLHRTTPLLPCALVTLPQIARYLLPFVTFFALYTYTTLPQTEERVSVCGPERQAEGAGLPLHSAAGCCAVIQLRPDMSRPHSKEANGPGRAEPQPFPVRVGKPRPNSAAKLPPLHSGAPPSPPSSAPCRQPDRRRVRPA